MSNNMLDFDHNFGKCTSFWFSKLFCRVFTSEIILKIKQTNTLLISAMEAASVTNNYMFFSFHDVNNQWHVGTNTVSLRITMIKPRKHCYDDDKLWVSWWRSYSCCATDTEQWWPVTSAVTSCGLLINCCDWSAAVVAEPAQYHYYY